MGLLSTILGKNGTKNRLNGERVFLRAPAESDYAEWAHVRKASRAFLEPWEPVWAEDELSRSAHQNRLSRYQIDHKLDLGYHFYVFKMNDNGLVGGFNLTNVRRGVAQTATLGYWAGEASAGRGLMSEALRILLLYAFSALKIRRIEAGCLPANARSIALLEAVGFQKEGYGRQYLKINGIWEDHLLYAMLREDPVRLARRMDH